MKKTQQKKYLEVLKKIKKELKENKKAQEALNLVVEEILNTPIIDDSQRQDQNDYPIPQELIDYGGVALFSDGACRGNPGPGSWGLMVQESSGEIIFEDQKFSEHTTNNKMELSGAIYALKYLKDQGRILEPVFLFTDSTYVVKGITEWVKGWKARGWKKADRKAPENLDLWQELDALTSEFFNLKYLWVKGHSGHPQNERCDFLANQALDEAGY